MRAPGCGGFSQRFEPTDQWLSPELPDDCGSRPVALGRQQLRLMLGDERIDDFTQRLAFDDRRQLVEREIDAVIADAALRKIIGADALRAVAGTDLTTALGCACRV